MQEKSQNSGPDKPEKVEEAKTELADLVHRTLLQLSDMDSVRDRIKELSERISKMTPPVDKAPDVGT